MVGGTAAASRPIMIVGISRRSGTNFLASVLLCHRDCGAPAAPVVEDHLLRDARLLERYVRRAARRWPRRWGAREEAQAALERSLGDGLLTFLSSRTAGLRTVSRTPHTDNLRLASTLYAGADIVLLVRDGRSVVESLIEAWGWTPDHAIREWRRGARTILDFQAQHPRQGDGARLLVVRYEDLLADFDGAVDRMLAFTGLDPAGFDRDKAHQLPIIGSSYIRDDDGRLTWKPVDRPAEFDPSARFADWPRARHERFNWLAGNEQRLLGYETESFGGPRARWRLRNTALDVDWAIRDRARVEFREVVNRLRERRADRQAVTR